jgi:hypothetical protein
VARADEDYDAAQVEAQRITVDTSRIASEAFPMAVPPEEAERRCRRALMEAWIGRETASFRLPPSRLALDPADVIRLQHDGRSLDFRLVSIADAEARGIEASARTAPPTTCRPAIRARHARAPAGAWRAGGGLPRPAAADRGPARAPALPRRPCRPWPGEIAVFRSPGSDGFELLTTVPARARMGVLAFDFWPGRSRASISAMRWSSISSPARWRASPIWPVRRGQCAGGREPPGRLGDRPGGRGRADRAGPLSADPPPARPARDGRRDGQSGPGRGAGGGARQHARAAAHRRWPISACRGTGASARRRARSDETYVAQAFTPAGAGCAPSRRSMSNSRGARARSPAI